MKRGCFKYIALTALALSLAGCGKSETRFPGYVEVKNGQEPTEYLFESSSVKKTGNQVSFNLVRKMKDGYAMQAAETDCLNVISFEAGTFYPDDKSGIQTYPGSGDAFNINTDIAMKALASAACAAVPQQNPAPQPIQKPAPDQSPSPLANAGVPATADEFLMKNVDGNGVVSPMPASGAPAAPLANAGAPMNADDFLMKNGDGNGNGVAPPAPPPAAPAMPPTTPAPADDSCNLPYPCRLQSIIDASDWNAALSALSFAMQSDIQTKVNWSSKKYNHKGYIERSGQGGAPGCETFKIVSFMGAQTGSDEIDACRKPDGTLEVK